MTLNVLNCISLWRIDIWIQLRTPIKSMGYVSIYLHFRLGINLTQFVRLISKYLVILTYCYKLYFYFNFQVFVASIWKYCFVYESCIQQYFDNSLPNFNSLFIDPFVFFLYANQDVCRNDRLAFFFSIRKLSISFYVPL